VSLSDLSLLWPILVPMGIALGVLTLRAARNVRVLGWFFPVFLVAAAAFPFVTGGTGGVPATSAIQLAVGFIALSPAAGLSAVVAALVIRLQAPRWVMLGAPAAACVVAAPAVLYATLLAVCSLTGDCL
jgi:hypothetical protein